MQHALKTVPKYFEKIQSGEKTFEIRRNDRPFKVGDKIILQEYDNDAYTGREVEKIITHCFSGEPKFGLRPSFIILSFGNIPPEDY